MVSILVVHSATGIQGKTSADSAIIVLNCRTRMEITACGFAHLLLHGARNRKRGCILTSAAQQTRRAEILCEITALLLTSTADAN